MLQPGHSTSGPSLPTMLIFSESDHIFFWLLSYFLFFIIVFLGAV